MLRMTGRKQLLVSSLGLWLAVAILTGCGAVSNGNGTNSNSSSGVSVSPATASVRAGTTQQFAATVNGTGSAGAPISQNVTWSVNGVAGGNSSLGLITGVGLYTAPVAIPSPNPIIVTASSLANSTLSGTSSVTVENPMPTVSGVSPATIALGSFSLTVTGTGFVSASQVTFGGQTLATTFVSATQLTATGTATTAQKGTTVNVAVVNPNPGTATSSSFPIKVGGTGVVAVNPAAASVQVGASQQFTATVSGSSNSGGTLSQTVTWSVNGIAGGNVSLGTITNAGLYKAPATVPSPDALSVTATSTTDTTITGSSVVTVQTPMPTVTDVGPSPVPVGSFSLTVLGTNFVNGAQVMFGSTSLSTTFVSTTQLKATGTATSAQNGTAVNLTVMNPGSVTSNVYVVHVGTSNTKISITPNSGTLLPGQTMQFKAVVTGLTSQTVTWTVDSAVGGNAQDGIITSAGVYTAPKTFLNDRATIGAIAADGTTANAPAQIALLSGLPVVNSALPLDIPLGSFTISVNGSGFLSGAQVALNGSFLTTTFISTTELSATGTASTAGTFPLDVTNPGAGSPTSNAIQVIVGSSNQTVTASAAARLLEQSTFGPTPALIEHVQAVGIQGFLNEQFTVAQSTYPAPAANSNIQPVQAKFFTNALYGQDQLRQRVAFALSEMMVISNQKIGDPSAFTSYMNMLQKDAFGNFSTLINDVTLSPAMGNYLDMANNDKPDPNSGAEPNENYAREILQLFTIGLSELNPDGSVQVDGSGNPIPTYSQDTIEGFAHVFTGWTYPTQPGHTGQFWNPDYYGGPMIPFDSHHDTGTKLLLNNVTLPAGGTTQADLTAALQNIFQHPNVGPFVCQQLIQHLVTSNPSPAYVQRVSTVFNDNGSGVRGDMKAVVTAILIDPEARRGDDPTQMQPSDGHLKEPLLFMLSLLRAANAKSDGTNLNWYASDMRQEPFESPTVFNFFPPNNPIAGTQLYGPEFKIFNSSTSITRANFVNDLVWGQVAQNTTVDLSPYIGLASSPAEMVDSLGGVLMHGGMSDSMRTTVLNTVTAISDNKKRAQTAFYLIGSSSQFQVTH
jgi:uncharacterized protein (DUF1800 family)